MYHQFTLNKEATLRAAKRNFLILVPVILIIFFLVIFLPDIISEKGGKTITTTNILIYSILALFFVFSFTRSFKKMRTLVNSYSLVIKEDTIVRRMEGHEEMSVRFSDIKEIIQYKNGAFSIRSHLPAIRVQIPHNIERREELAGLLAGIHPIKKAGIFTPDSKWSLLILCLVGASVICGITLENRLIVAIAGLVLLIFYAWVIYLIFIRKTVTQTVRKKSWIFVLALGLLLLNILFKLMGYYTPK
jgi:hypothetical protein